MRFHLLFISVFLFLIPARSLATTYVVMEGDSEVGRYDEPDGRSEIKYLRNEKPKPPPPPAANTEDIPGEQLAAPPQWQGFLSSLQKDPEFVAFLNQQPWMKRLRELDKQYDLEKNLTLYQGRFQQIVILLLGAWLAFRIYRLIAWLFFRKKKSENPR